MTHASIHFRRAAVPARLLVRAHPAGGLEEIRGRPARRFPGGHGAGGQGVDTGREEGEEDVVRGVMGGM